MSCHNALDTLPYGEGGSDHSWFSFINAENVGHFSTDAGKHMLEEAQELAMVTKEGRADDDDFNRLGRPNAREDLPGEGEAGPSLTGEGSA